MNFFLLNTALERAKKIQSDMRFQQGKLYVRIKNFYLNFVCFKLFYMILQRKNSKRWKENSDDRFFKFQCF